MSDIIELKTDHPKKAPSKKRRKRCSTKTPAADCPPKDTPRRIQYYQQLMKGVAEKQVRLQKTLKELESTQAKPAAQLSEEYAVLKSAREELAAAEEQLRRQNEELQVLLKSVETERGRYQKLFEFIPAGHIVTDGAGIIEEASSRAALLLNLSWHVLIGKPLIGFLNKTDRKNFHKHLLSLKRGEQVLGWEVLLHPRKKEFLAVSVIAAPFYEGNDVKVHWLINDISKKKQIQDELLQKTALFERVVNCSLLGTIAFDTDCRYTLWNPALEEMSGIRREEVLGKYAFDVFPFLKTTGEEKYYFDALAGKTTTAEDRPFRSPVTGREMRYDSQYSPLKDTSGKILGGFITIRDITGKKKTEEALRQSEEKYRTLFENSLLGIFAVDLKGRYLSVNPAARKLLGYSLEEILGDSYRKHVAPGSVTYVLESYNKVFRTGNPVSNLQYEIITKSGESRIIESNVAILMADGKTIGFQATALDITERKQAEESLHLTNLFLEVANRHSRMEPLLDDLVRIIQELFHCEAVGIRVYDAGDQIVQQRYAGFSKEFFESICPLSHKKECCRCRDSGEQAVEGPPTGRSQEVSRKGRDHTCPCKLAGYNSVVSFPIKVEQRQVGVIQIAGCTEQAFEERKLNALEQALSHIATSVVRIQMNETVRQALQVSHQKTSETSALLETLRAVLEHQTFSKAAEMIVSSCKRLIGAAAGYITVRNDEEGYEEIVVISSDSTAPKMKPKTRLPVCGLRAAVYNSAEAFYSNSPNPSEQGELLPKKVNPKNFLVSPIQLHDQPAGLMVLFDKPDGFCDEDLKLAGAFAGQAAVAFRNSMYLEALQKSEARYRWLSEGLEATVRKKLAELQQARTLATIGQMVSVVAHEIRNPLQNIYMGVDSLRKEISPEKAEILDEISYGVGMLNAIVRELLDYSKPVNLVFASWSPSDIIRHALNMVNDRLVNVNVKKVLKSVDRKIVFDAERISSVLVNLITNAIEAMPGGGELTISSEFCIFEGADWLKISISDTGCGIDQENIHRIEEPFFTTKTQGTGLGISICKKIIAAHRGQMKISSQKGKGTTVEFFLPAQAEVQQEQEG